MNSDPLLVVCEVYNRFSQNDWPGIFQLLSPEVEIFQTPMLPWGGDFKGHDGVQKFFSHLSQFNESVLTPDQFVLAGDDVVMVGRLRARKANALATLSMVHVLTVRDGVVIRFAAYVDTPGMQTLLGADRSEAGIA